MKSGYITKTKDNTYENIKAVKPLMERYGFSYNEQFKRFRLKRLWDTVFVFCKEDRIIINVLFNFSIDTDFIDEAALEMLKINSRYHLNLGLDNNNGETTSDFTIFTPVCPCSTQVFEELFYKHINNIEKRYSEFFGAVNDYISREILTLDEDFLNLKINADGKKLEKLIEDWYNDDDDSESDKDSGFPSFDISDLMDISSGHNEE